MTPSKSRIRLFTLGLASSLVLAGCAGDPLESGIDPFAPMVFKEGATAMPLNLNGPSTNPIPWACYYKVYR